MLLPMNQDAKSITLACSNLDPIKVGDTEKVTLVNRGMLIHCLPSDSQPAHHNVRILYI